MDNEQLRRLFGQFGDVNEPLTKMFGKAYTDYPDESRKNIPLDFFGMNVRNIGGLIGRAVEIANDISCQTNQFLVLTFLKEYIGDTKMTVPTSDWWQVIKHMETCSFGQCRTLYEISCKDKRLTRGEMDKFYGETIRKWESRGFNNPSR